MNRPMNGKVAKCALFVLFLVGSLLMVTVSADTYSQAVHPRVIFMAASSASSAPPAVEWNLTFAGESGNSVIQTSDDGYALVGKGFQSNALLVKTDSLGVMQWSQNYSINNAYDIVQTHDGGYTILGSSGGGATLVKTDSEGKVQWSQTYNQTTTGDETFSGIAPKSMVYTDDNGYAIAGITFSPNSDGVLLYDADVALMKTDSSGNLLWHMTYGGVGDDEATSIVQTIDGGYALTGYTTSFGVGGRPVQYSNVDLRRDFWFIKTNSMGNVEWSRTFGDGGDNEATSVIQTSDGGYALAGYTRVEGFYGYDAWLIRTDYFGRTIWNQTYGVAGDWYTDAANDLIQTSDDGFAFAGSTVKSPASGYYAWLVKTDSSGKLQWNETYSQARGIINTWSASSLIEARDGSLVMLGTGEIGGSRITESNYFLFVKTTPFLPPPQPPIEPTPPTSPSFSPPLAFPPTTIKADGSVDPSTTLINHDGNIYTFTGNLNGQLIVEKDNIIIDGAGYALQGNGTIADLYIRASGIGINLTGRSEVTIRNLRIEEYLDAVYLRRSNNITLAENVVSQNGIGIYVTGQSTNIKLHSNEVSASDGQGMTLNDTSGTIVSENRIWRNAQAGGVAGIVLVFGSNNLIVGNTIENNEDGMWLGSTSNNTVAGNNFTNNYYGLQLLSRAETGVIYCNNFVNNSVSAYDSDDVYENFNKWDNGTIGNYWSDYTTKYHNATELNSSGIGDTSYIVQTLENPYLTKRSTSNIDHYPLMKPFSSSEASALTQTLILAHEPSLPPADVTSEQDVPLYTLLALSVIAVAIVLAAVVFARRMKKLS